MFAGRAVAVNRVPTVGVEEELLLVDADDHQLVGRSDEVLARLAPPVGELVDQELKLSQVETATPVCSELREVHEHLVGLREAVDRAAAGIGCRVLAAGTHPVGLGRRQELTPKAAYERIQENYGRLAEEQMVCGCHVHVGVEHPDLRIAVLDRVRTQLAPLLALSANSPFWEGDDTGFASYRFVTFSRWPTFGTPEPLGDWAGYRGLLDTLVSSGAIDAPARLYWTVRPSARYPTLEFRVADVPLHASESVMVAGLCRALVVTAITDIEAGHPVVPVRGELVRIAEWQAARHGLRGDLLDPERGTSRPAVEAVHELLGRLAPVLDRLGDLDAVERAVARVLEEGNGADRQRAAERSVGSVGGVTAALLAPEEARATPA
jgi:glutamate---cysteine ligase / carboxylate-amine ligase